MQYDTINNMLQNLLYLRELLKMICLLVKAELVAKQIIDCSFTTVGCEVVSNLIYSQQ